MVDALLLGSRRKCRRYHSAEVRIADSLGYTAVYRNRGEEFRWNALEAPHTLEEGQAGEEEASMAGRLAQQVSSRRRPFFSLIF